MRFSAKQYAYILYETTTGKNTGGAFEAFMTLVKKHKQTRMLERIGRAYEKLLLQNDALPEVVVRTREALSGEIKKEVSAKFNLPASIPVREIIDPSMIGGLSIKYNNMLFDFSLQTRLAKLKRQLIR